MAVLKNQRWEAFAVGLAKGMTGDQAYQEAGYEANRGNAARLKANECIKARVAELAQSIADKATVDQAWVVDTLVENVNRAMQAAPVLDHEGNPTGDYRYEGSVANRALELIGKHLGMFADKLNINLQGNLPQSLDEMLALIGREKREKANGHTTH